MINRIFLRYPVFRIHFFCHLQVQLHKPSACFSGHGCPEGNHADSSYSLPEVLSSMTTWAAGHQLTSALHCSWIHQIPLRFRAQARSEDLLREVKCPVVQSWGLLERRTSVVLVSPEQTLVPGTRSLDFKKLTWPCSLLLGLKSGW